jgi:hypothetical protein
MALTPEQYIDRNIEAILSKIKPSERVGAIGPTRIQRIMCIGYNQACHTLDEMKRRGLIKNNKPWNYEWVVIPGRKCVSPICWNCNGTGFDKDGNECTFNDQPPF